MRPPPDLSLWAAAARRLRGDPAALASLAVLILIGLACAAGPLLTGHAFGRLSYDYPRTPPSLEVYPRPGTIGPALERLALRMRVRAEEIALEPGAVRVTLAADRPIDARVLGFFARSDLFAPATLLGRAEDGRRLSLRVPVRETRFLLGTDTLGRDLLTQVLVGGRVSLALGLLATAVALGIGVAYGALAGYLGGAVDAAMMRLVDILYALPFVFFVILLVVVFGRSLALVFVAVGAVEWLDMARIVRGEALAIRRQDYVRAAEALGLGTGAILRRHVVPNALGPVLAYAALLIPRVILLESFLSFLGLGVQEPMTSWGVLIADGARSIESAPWMLLAPAAALVATLVALTLLGDRLRDALDPRGA
ncbi:binding-protein-dependent transport systems inner membrane component [Methylobacterium sp. 4-46]|uniref:ABC transporter permease n=1 Tax=unclassified Methylobacterium TaxID=2615210 RepID=UPI000152D2A1|nr:MULTISPECIES: ABC transporter permease subunit [Methylobacterium]ACA19663.1 binding-protein-dependent transport systems inner membrane component [Methylobacterium sp. 4-46]WFT78859.1 ABC transporter permease subunit [Methylobacterium nodulans]